MYEPLLTSFGIRAAFRPRNRSRYDAAAHIYLGISTAFRPREQSGYDVTSEAVAGGMDRLTREKPQRLRQSWQVSGGYGCTPVLI